LTTNTSTLTALSNDYSFDYVFSRQVDALIVKNDVLIGISTSGGSINVINALKRGRELGSINIVFTGKNISKIRKYTDYIISVPSEKTSRIQESHIMIGHIICYLVERELFGEKLNE
jgi:D-sedoheptulose 7-phosphate isomerase